MKTVITSIVCSFIVASVIYVGIKKEFELYYQSKNTVEFIQEQCRKDGFFGGHSISATTSKGMMEIKCLQRDLKNAIQLNK